MVRDSEVACSAVSGTIPSAKLQDRALSACGAPCVQAANKWPDGAIALPASDLIGLEAEQAVEVIKSLLELCRTVRGDEIVILELEFPSDTAFGAEIDKRVETIRGLFARISAELSLCPPHLIVEKRDGQVDLRVFPVYH